MPENKKITSQEKERKLIQKIEKTKKELLHLQEKRRSEIGKLACKHGLDNYDDTVLNTSFAKLSKTLAHGNP